MSVRRVLGPVLIGLLAATIPSASSLAASEDFARARFVQQVSEQSVAPKPGSEPDTETEPDIAIDPNNPSIVVGVMQRGRYPDGGSVDPGFTTSHDGGRTWIEGNLPGLTVAVGGPYDRASDPVVAFGPGGTVYANTIAFDAACDNSVAVNRSDDGGLSWQAPVFLQVDGCAAFNDKNWITVDTFPSSPHFGRVYVAWDRLSCGQPIVLRYSDDEGRTWSGLKNVSGECTSGIGAYPVVQPDGDLTIVYLDLSTGRDVAQTSGDGGNSFGPKVTITTPQDSSPPDMRVGSFLPSAAVDPTTGEIHVVWMDTRFRTDGLNDVLISRSTDGAQSWSAPTRVNQDPPGSQLDHLTPDVAAHGGFVHVVYRTRNNAGGPSDLIGMRYIHSEDGGASFGGEMLLGPKSDNDFAAEAGGIFYGDYMGVAASGRSVHPIWCLAGDPADGREYHQTTWSATIRR
jgi:hypothetical protein